MIANTRIARKLKYVYGLCKQREREGHLPASRQMLEIACLMFRHGVGYDFYHYARMWERGASWDYKRSFLGQKDYTRAVARLNEHKYRAISQFKPVEKAFFRQFDIPTATYLGTFQQTWGTARDGKPLTSCRELAELLSSRLGRRVCFKPVEGYGGKGFTAFKVEEGGHGPVFEQLASKATLVVEELVAKLHAESRDGWLIEDYIDQHPVLASFNASSVNTIRMFLFQHESGEVTQLESFLKTGRPGSLIDKTEGGGAAVHIDKRSGTLLDGFDWSPAMHTLPSHPASGQVFKGTRIPFWQEAEQLGKRALQAMPGTRFVGVDIAITRDGPLMVEMNVLPDADCLPILGIRSAVVFKD